MERPRFRPVTLSTRPSIRSPLEYQRKGCEPFARGGGVNTPPSWSFLIPSACPDLNLAYLKLAAYNPNARTEVSYENHHCTDSVKDLACRTNARTRNSASCLRALRSEERRVGKECR